MLELDQLRTELEKQLQSSRKPSLYCQLGLSANSSDIDICSAIVKIKNDQCSSQPLSPEQTYAIEILGVPESREIYDRKLFSRISNDALHLNGVASEDKQLHQAVAESIILKKWHVIVALLVLVPAMYVALNVFQGKSIRQTIADTKTIFAGKKTSVSRGCSRVIPIYSAQEKKSAIKRLEDKGIAISSENLVEAIEWNDTLAVADLLKAGINPNKPAPGDDELPIRRVFFGKPGEIVEKLESIRLLVSHGADVNNQISSALIDAAIFRQMEIAEYLLGQCADVNLRSAQMMPNGPVLASGHTPLTAAIEGGSIEIVRLFLKNGANPHQVGGFNMTPFYTASTRNMELVLLLIEHGAQVTEVGQTGWTPLIAAMSTKKYDIATYLIEHGANISFVATNGYSAMVLAKRDQRSDIIDLLRAKGIKD